MVNEADVLDWLRVCFDPELPINIVDIGLVERISVAIDQTAPGVDTRYRVGVELTMRSPNEEREAMLLGQVKNRLAGLAQISRADVTLSTESKWTAKRLSPAARRQLQVSSPDDLVQIKL